MNAKIIVNRNFVVSEIDSRMFSGFIEHLGRAVYGGIYEPGHPEADSDGFRQDVYKMVKELDMPLTRYPGGNFVSAYNWEDGIGPREKRPKRLDFAWKSLETNQFGTDEFMAWCQKAGTAPMIAVNLGTRGPAEAQSLVEYCNCNYGSYWSDLRRKYGREQPYAVKTWCLGNEIDGAWQAGHKNAGDYGKIALEAAKMMKNTDPSIELVVCGSSSMGMSTFGDWDATVLEYTYDFVDYISLHAYYGNRNDDTALFLAQSEKMEQQIKQIVAVCDYVAALKRSTKTMMLSFDEWNIWYHSSGQEKNSEEWTAARPILEDIYNMEDALLVGCMLITLLNNADRVKIACLAQTVNVIAPIMTGKGGSAWRQTIFYPFKYTAAYGRGRVLRQIIDSPVYEVKFESGKPRQISYLASTVVYNEQAGEISVFAVNRSLEEDLSLKVMLGEFFLSGVIEWLTMHHRDLKAGNSEGHEHIVPEVAGGAEIENNCLSATLSAASWNMIRIKVS